MPVAFHCRSDFFVGVLGFSSQIAKTEALFHTSWGAQRLPVSSWFFSWVLGKYMFSLSKLVPSAAAGSLCGVCCFPR